MSEQILTPQQLRVHEKLSTDLRYFCANAMRIKLKEGGEAPFIWNKAQEYLHQRIEDQLARTGMVRMFILKGRQQGISTYIAARFYHKATRNRNRNVFILSHHAVTTEALFQIVDRYHNSCPPAITPKCLVSNNRRMRFSNGSQYTVGTAGSGAIGRGDTNQYIHASECAFYENTDEINTGVMQTVSDSPGTEKINESTANGVGNYFHQGCMEALEGIGRYELVFIPWYWQDEYRSPVNTDQNNQSFQLTAEEQTLKDMYLIDDEQIQWRRNKIAELKSERKFKQEYPFSVQEAFQASGHSLIDPEKIAIARKSAIQDPNAPLILGVDPARQGDRSVIAWRRGREVQKVEVFREMDEMLLAGKLAQRIDRYGVAKCFIDVALGYGTLDRLKELGYGDVVMGVSFSQQPNEPEKYLNKRAEMAFALRDWIHEGGCSLPDDEEVAVDLAAVPDFKESSRGLLQLEAKDTIRKTYGKSTDIFDALMLTFAQPVRRTIDDNTRIRKAWNRDGRSELSAVSRRKQRRNASSASGYYDDAGGDDTGSGRGFARDPRSGGLRTSRKRDRW